MEDFLHPEGKVSLFCEETPVQTDSSLLSSLYFYWVSNDQSGKALTPSEIRARKTALKCIKVQYNVQQQGGSRNVPVRLSKVIPYKEVTVNLCVVYKKVHYWQNIDQLSTTQQVWQL